MAKLPYYDTKTYTNLTTARIMSPNFGRWLSPDPAGLKAVRLDDPQTWNMYAYVRNNPTTLNDPSGLAPPDTLLGANSDTRVFSGTGPYLENNGETNSPPAASQPPAGEKAQNQDSSKWKQGVVATIEFQKDARAAYEKFGPTAKSVEELEQNVTKALEKKYGQIGTAGSTDSSGKVEIKPDPNPYTREATRRHESVHQQTVKEGIAKYGKGTPAFKAWFYNPQHWATDEVKAYSAGIRYLEQSLRQMDGP